MLIYYFQHHARAQLDTILFKLVRLHPDLDWTVEEYGAGVVLTIHTSCLVRPVGRTTGDEHRHSRQSTTF